MASKNSGSDNPWAEMSKLKLDSKEAKEPAVGTSRAATVKSEEPAQDASDDVSVEDSVQEKVIARESSDKKGVESEASEYSEEQLQELSLDELQALAEEAGIDFEGMSQDEIVESLLSQGAALTVENQDDEEEIILEEDEESLEAEEIDGEMSLEEAMALLGEDGETEDDFAEAEFEVVEEEVLEGDADFEQPGNN
jgi:hypothetical protein